MMNLLARVIKWFKGPTPEEAYANGRATALQVVGGCSNKQDMADYLYGMASGGFNTTEAHREFDRGVNDQLAEMGYPSPY